MSKLILERLLTNHPGMAIFVDQESGYIHKLPVDWVPPYTVVEKGLIGANGEEEVVVSAEGYLWTLSAAVAASDPKIGE
jgi:hypothetical protein